VHKIQTRHGKFSKRLTKEGVSDYVTRVITVANQIKSNGETLSDGRIVEKILRSLTDEFENVVCAIEESKDLDEVTVDELTGSLEAHEARKKKKKQEKLEEALQAKVSISGDKKNRGQQLRDRGRGHGYSRGSEGENEEKKWEE